MDKNIFSALDSDDEVEVNKQVGKKPDAKQTQANPSTKSNKDGKKHFDDKKGEQKKTQAPPRRIPGYTAPVKKPYTGEGVIDNEEKEPRKFNNYKDKPKRTGGNDAHPQGDKHSGTGYGYK